MQISPQSSEQTQLLVLRHGDGWRVSNTVLFRLLMRDLYEIVCKEMQINGLLKSLYKSVTMRKMLYFMYKLLSESLKQSRVQGLGKQLLGKRSVITVFLGEREVGITKLCNDEKGGGWHVYPVFLCPKGRDRRVTQFL